MRLAVSGVPACYDITVISARNPLVAHPLFDRHKPTLDAAVNAIRTRGYWSVYPEVPSGKVYGETAKDDGVAAFQNRLQNDFVIDQPSTGKTIGGEVSPYGMKLGVAYPQVDLDTLIPAAQQAMKQWGSADIET